MPNTDTKPEGPLELLSRDHRELDRLFEELHAALRADARDDALRLWTSFEDGLCRHMNIEEQYVLPLLQRRHPRETQALLKEHDDLRTGLAELGVGVDLHEVGAQTVADFVERLRRHAQREEALAYRFAEESLPASERQRVSAGLAGASAFRQRLIELGRKAKARASSP